MLPLERHRLIVELLGQHGVMRVNEIAQATRVSRETIRRDLSELERKGILTRSHGGALAAENPLPATRAAASALPVESSGLFRADMPLELAWETMSRELSAALHSPELV